MTAQNQKIFESRQALPLTILTKALEGAHELSLSQDPSNPTLKTTNHIHQPNQYRGTQSHATPMLPGNRKHALRALPGSSTLLALSPSQMDRNSRNRSHQLSWLKD